MFDSGFEGVACTPALSIGSLAAFELSCVCGATTGGIGGVVFGVMDAFSGAVSSLLPKLSGWV